MPARARAVMAAHLGAPTAFASSATVLIRCSNPAPHIGARPQSPARLPNDRAHDKSPHAQARMESRLETRSLRQTRAWWAKAALGRARTLDRWSGDPLRLASGQGGA